MTVNFSQYFHGKVFQRHEFWIFYSQWNLNHLSILESEEYWGVNRTGIINSTFDGQLDAFLTEISEFGNRETDTAVKAIGKLNPCINPHNKVKPAAIIMFGSNYLRILNLDTMLLMLRIMKYKQICSNNWDPPLQSSLHSVCSKYLNTLQELNSLSKWICPPEHHKVCLIILIFHSTTQL